MDTIPLIMAAIEDDTLDRLDNPGISTLDYDQQRALSAVWAIERALKERDDKALCEFEAISARLNQWHRAAPGTGLD